MKKSGRDNNFNLLRFVFASLVIVSHAPEIKDGNRSEEILTRLFGTISFGELSVDGFFILSGYLIIQSWLSGPRLTAFLSSRILRIYPGFIVASLICAFIVGPCYGTPSYLQGFEWKSFFLGLTRLSFRGIPQVFAGTHEATLNAAVWTIPYEFRCYLVVLACGLAGLFSKRGVWLALFLLDAVAYCANATGLLHIPFDFYVRFFMLFSAGGCFYLFRDDIPWRNDLAWIAFVLTLALLYVKPLAEPALCTFGAYALLQFAMTGRSLLAFNKLPDISYGLYLYAWPINKIVLWHFPNIEIYLSMFVVFLISAIAGTVSWYTVEAPFMKMKVLFRKPSVQSTSITT